MCENPTVAKQQYLDEVLRPLLPPQVSFVEPCCPHFNVCGGCQLQHIDYPSQLAFKQLNLIRILATADIDAAAIVEPTRGLVDEPYHYRNKADFSARTWDGALHLGYRPYGGKGALVEIAECPIVLPAINDTLAAIRQVLPTAPELARKLVSVVIRSSLATNETAVLYHSKLKDEAVYANVTTAARAIFPRLSGGTFVKKRKEYVTGTSELVERIGELELHYSVRSFFQTNPRLLPQFCAIVDELADPCERGVLLDIFCGVGLFALYLADKFDEVYGIENTPCSVRMAKENAKRNGNDTTVFLRDVAEDRLARFVQSGIRPNLIVLDPPRSGLGERVVQSLLSLEPAPVIVLVSCNPYSLATDLAGLIKGGYHLERVVPVDMFPQTEHLEVVTRLTR